MVQINMESVNVQISRLNPMFFRFALHPLSLLRGGVDSAVALGRLLERRDGRTDCVS